MNFKEWVLINLAEEISGHLNVQAVAWVPLGTSASFILRMKSKWHSQVIFSFVFHQKGSCCKVVAYKIGAEKSLVAEKISIKMKSSTLYQRTFCIMASGASEWLSIVNAILGSQYPR